ncbi:MAG: HAD family hydrolase [Gammaproteobacteria bacterium]|jgi:HAD superfamily hydrolase (TIGR01509 family)
MKTALKALLLDVDGTLADTEEIHRRAFNAAFAEAGLDWVWERDLYHELLAVAGGRERIRYYLERHRPDAGLPADADGLVTRLHARKTAFYVNSLATGEVPLRPGVERLMKEAREQGLRLAIVTTTTPDNVIALLDNSFEHHVRDWFDVIAAGGVVPQKKPAPDIYDYALQELDLTAGECIAIEDSENGLRAAHAAGIATLITVNPYTQGHDFSGAAAVLDHLGESGLPCRLLAGNLPPGPLIDTAYLRKLHAMCREGV